MQLRRAGKSGLMLSRIGLGTMTWGRDTDEHEAAEQCRAFLDAGGNFIDTAAVYGDGDSERVIGGLIGTLFERNDVVIASKAGISFPQGNRKVDNSRSALIAQLDASLQRLNTDYLDLWQVHSWDPETPLDDTLSALDYAYTSGKARYIGISNFSGWQSAHAITRQEVIANKAPITTIQNEYSLLNRKVEEDIIDAVDKLNVGFLAWSPLGRGVLTGKYRKGVPSDSRAATPHFASFVEPYLSDKHSQIVEAVCVAAEGLGYSPLEVALAWVRDCAHVTSVILGARTGAQLRGALSSEEVILPDVVRTALNEVSRIA
jgi:aryl-alcohol dehydrogenase-like predicted oxidoreductase